MGLENAEALLAKLRESHLSTDERRTALDFLRTTLDSLFPDALVIIAKAAIRDGPNDVRRIAFQTLSSRIDADLFKNVAHDSARDAVNELIKTTETFVRTTLKVQNSKSLSSSARTATDILNLPTSSLRATAAALKTLHALIRISPKKARSTNLASQSSGETPSLTSLFDIILPCLSAGLQAARPTPASIPRSSSSLQAGAFTWGDQSRQARTLASRSNPSSRNADHLECSSAGETDRKSDKSESERSDFSIASTSNRSRKDESRQQEATAKLIRQNALHCLVELNRHESRALISRWSDLLPDQPAMSHTPDRSIKPSSVTSRLSSSSASAPFSLCTLITQDPSTSVRLAAMAVLECILSHGTLQLSMAQERAQRALSFTSLSSQLAGWIVNIRTYLVVALQCAAAAPRASARAEGSAEVVGYPSSLTVALLQLTRTFVTCTSKAKLVSNNASVLAPAVMPFVSNSDPQVQAAAKQLIAILTPPSEPTTESTVETRTQQGARLASIESITPSQSQMQPDAAQLDLTNLLGDGADPTPENCERVLAAFETATDPLRQLPTLSIFIKSIADACAPLLSPEASARLFAVWQRLCAQPSTTPDQQCAILSVVPDLCKALSRHLALDAGTWTAILQYVERCCSDADEAVRAAAVRVLGLLVLPSDGAIDATDEHHRRISKTTDDVLWASRDKASIGALHDSSSLVRQRASWAFSNAMEAWLRSQQRLDEHEWIAHARYCLEAGRDMEGIAVSAYRASGTLLALLTSADASNQTCRSLGRSLLEQLCRVLSTTSKPPKSRWNAASALDRALGSDVVLTSLLDPCGASGDGLMDRIVELLCSNLDAKVFKIRVSAANALVSLCGSSQQPAGNRLDLLGEQRIGRIRRFAWARLAELKEPATSKESTLHLDELKRLLSSLAASIPPPPS
ncbi:uncharacterized protein SPSC_03272 [Sporisorium scitamineum]|uniref:DUF4042 domain-containing protein n=1 Tax=Sporisorium scitamineum TaxID=49012 RepID=A0A0F7S938_9BASI|nr:uncharacterized protein SPSC_03272 [Sporisorium scitamineum]CDW99432.1 hypothetical protein [Sporisorium scitamineum]